MLWIIEGDDLSKKNTELQNIKDKVSPDQIVRFGAVNEEVISLIDAQDLFSEKKLVVVSHADFKDIETHILSLCNSVNFFVFFVDKLLAPEKKKLGGAVYIDCTLSKTPQIKFNVFAISDAFASKNKKDMWVLYQKALQGGVSEQEIVGIVLWQIKTLLICLRVDQKNTSIKPFVYNKAKKSLALFSGQELEKHYKTLVSLYHDSRRGKDLAVSFERFILSL